MKERTAALRITAGYVALAVLWIYFSDRLVSALPAGEAARMWLHTTKGWLFVVVSALALYALVSGQLSRLATSMQRLRASQERFELVMESLEDGLWDWDLVHDRIYYSPQWKRQLGFDAGEISDDVEEWRSRIHPDDRQEVLAAVDDCLESEVNVFEKAFRMRCKSGDYIHVLARGGVVRDGQGRPLRFAGTNIDITRDRQANEKLRQAGKVLESTSEGVMITDSQGRIQSVNPAFTAITGYTEPEVTGSTPGILKSGRHDEGFYRQLWSTVASEGHWSGEIWNRRKNGEIFPEWETISVVTDETGTVTNYLAVFHDISRIKRSEQQVSFLTHYDPLTRLPNRVLLRERLSHALDLARRQGRQVAVIMLDMDRFKYVNESLGHTVGDRFLQAVARRLESHIRGEDTLARVGGDEFVILIEELGAAGDALTVVRKVAQEFGRPFNIDGRELHVTGSIGVSLFPADGGSVETLLKNADAALYHAKKLGGTAYHFYDAGLTRQASRRVSLETALHRALDREELKVVYQPQVSLETGYPTGVEALIRWHPGEGEPVSPVTFIPLAEESGLIVPIGEWVLEQACRQLIQWQEQGLPCPRMAVNVSGIQVRHDDFLVSVERIMDQTGITPDSLELEITEGTLFQAADESDQTLHAAREMGMTVAIDDFGTGYSSLSRLRHLPLDRLKIDRSFVQGLPADQGNEAITRSVLELARAMDLSCIAEGVESPAERDYLQCRGCHEVQGFLCSRPLPASDIGELLGNWEPCRNREVICEGSLA